MQFFHDSLWEHIFAANPFFHFHYRSFLRVSISSDLVHCLPSTSRACLAASLTSSLSVRHRYTSCSMLSLACDAQTQTARHFTYNPPPTLRCDAAYSVIPTQITGAHLTTRLLMLCKHIYIYIYTQCGKKYMCWVIAERCFYMHKLTFRHASALQPHTRVSTLSSSSNSRQLTNA